MNKAINAIWKYLDKSKGKWWSIAKIVLAILILSFSAYYLFWRFPSIIKGGERQIDTAIIAISAIIILLPFLSEIELFGVRFKKEIEKAKKEVIEDVERIISVKIKNQPIYINRFDSEIHDIKKAFSEIRESENEVGDYQKIPKPLLALLELRTKLSSMVSLIYAQVKSSFFENYTLALEDRLQSEIDFLKKENVLSNEGSELIKEVFDICQDVYEGKPVDNHAIQTALDSEKDLLALLSQVLNEMMMKQYNSRVNSS